MWSESATFFEDEDEAALRDRFAKLVAQYPKQDPYEIAAYVFKDLRDPYSRSQQAAMVWLKDIEFKELVRLYSADQVRADVPSKDEAAKLAWELAQDMTADKKDRIAALKLFAEINSMIVKVVDKTVDDATTRKRPPTIVFARYAD